MAGFGQFESQICQIGHLGFWIFFGSEIVKKKNLKTLNVRTRNYIYGNKFRTR
jgi:hypothetical protein